MITREEVLKEAIKIVSDDRNTIYGEPEDSFAQIAKLWAIYTRHHFEPHDVAVMLVLLKIARIENNPCHKDNWIDIAGYAACGASTLKTEGE